MTEQKQPEALRLIAEWRNSMPIGVMRIWAADVRDELRRQHAEIESLQDDLVHKDDYAEQLGRELAKADSEAKELRARLDELARQEPVGGFILSKADNETRFKFAPTLDMLHDYQAAGFAVTPVYLAAGARPVGEVPAGEYPPLPEVYATMHDDGHWTMKAGKEPYESHYAGWRKTVYTADQMWRYVDADRAMRATQPAPAAQDDAKDAARLYPVVIDGLLWLCTKHGGTFKPVDDCAAVNPPLSWKNALAANKKEPT